MELLRQLRLSIGLTLTFVWACAAQPAPPGEYSLKAVFLYNFVRFVDWPESAFTSPNDPFVIGIVGSDPFGALLYEAIAGETYHGRPITVVHFATPRDIRHCHLLFVSQGNRNHYDAILEQASGQGLLTVGETESFLDRGGMIALTTEQSRVHVRINGTALRNSALGVSSKLLQVAQIR
ncbi:MAG TPA: YfiR family protein [Chthoniobacterales bacterium]